MTRLHLKFLDSVRGLTAIYVVLFHLVSTQESAQSLPPTIVQAVRLLRYGHFAVDVFIVLSGYCLMLPVIRSEHGSLPGGLQQFIYRRARRIFPPAWAALAFTIAMILLVRLTGSRVRADDGTVFEAGNLLTHVFMVHNWFPRYLGSINLPMWTVAWEWQIYFVFALVLLPVWRRWGLTTAVATALLLGWLPLAVLPAGFDGAWTRPWYLGLFALGMAAAALNYGKAQSGLRFGLIAFLLIVAVVSIELVGGNERAMSSLWAKDVLVGAAAACGLAYLANIMKRPAAKRSAGEAALTAALEWRPVVMLGTFSYSLYLIHLPLMWPTKFAVGALNLSAVAELAFRLLVAPAYILPAAYLFYLAFERPFLSVAARPDPFVKADDSVMRVQVAGESTRPVTAAAR